MSNQPLPETPPVTQNQPVTEVQIDVKRPAAGVTKIEVVYPPLENFPSVYANHVQVSGRPPEDIALDFCQIHSQTAVLNPDGSMTAKATLGVRVHMTVSQATRLLAILPIALGITLEEASAKTRITQIDQGQET